MHEYQLPINIEGLKIYHHKSGLDLELGGRLDRLSIGYHTFGKLNERADNVIWVCHALTANSDVSDWWKGLFGENDLFDPSRYFIVCANILGSCYGTTGPLSFNLKKNEPYGIEFPLISIRDMANAHDILRKHLKIEKIELCIGGSCGGHQVLEFAFLRKKIIKNLALLVCGARESAWAIATHAAQRLAIEADPSWKENSENAGKKGLKAARGMGLLTYRTFHSYIEKQTDEAEKSDDFRATSYIDYQGEKLVRRFDAKSYWYLTKALDTFNIGRGRGGVAAALTQLTMPAIVVSIDSDLLIPPSEQAILVKNMPNAHHEIIDSDFGHDGFLIEFEKIRNVIFEWYKRDSSF